MLQLEMGIQIAMSCRVLLLRRCALGASGTWLQRRFRVLWVSVMAPDAQDFHKNMEDDLKRAAVIVVFDSDPSIITLRSILPARHSDQFAVFESTDIITV